MQNSPQDTPSVSPEIARRRTFAIISHPDAGKTTLTEQFLLHGGAIRMAGQVRAKGNARRTRSDFMKVEKERGVSVSASAMSFDYGNFRFNLVDTPGHADFSEDTYRTLTAVDAAIMVIDGARGVESQTRKLFEICRLRDMPILTFCNKMDRDARDTLEIIEEIQDNLAIDVVPRKLADRIGAGLQGLLQPGNRSCRDHGAYASRCHGTADRIFCSRRPGTRRNPVGRANERARRRGRNGESASPLQWTARRSSRAISRRSGLAPHCIPMASGRSWTVSEPLLPLPATGLPSSARCRRTSPKSPGSCSRCRQTWIQGTGTVSPFSGCVQDTFRRGMKLVQVRTRKPVSIASPVLFLASDRTLTEEAWAGDIIGIPNHGQLRIGDSLAEREPLRFTGIPTFAPEILRTVMVNDPLMSKHLEKALTPVCRRGCGKTVPSTGRCPLDRRRGRRAPV